MSHELSLAPSPWLERWAHLLRPGMSALDVACGSGRHVRFLAARGLGVTAVDRDAEALAGLRTQAEVLVADLEGAPWPLAGRRFDLVLVTNYLWRPLWPALLASLAPGGLLLYETFARGNETVGRPSRAEFLLEPGELLRVCANLRIVGYEDGFLAEPQRFVQRIAALAPDPAAAAPLRIPLAG
ncbi:class I SAM-dependent methyltransferase [Aquincola sp. S2]|uniref:Class I SAM-dependent methyltransferase n=1 Tax=Pseudaquabacterium terrae TaxID=2732868 RepID=A0ABX2EN27_9BURK|nr:class I SAM-dependent methyltransferase [Aquabacterium terrae]NRF70056.1 class I SAM-dependent methyltransferase [Aquabacterium terrae]